MENLNPVFSYNHSRQIQLFRTSLVLCILASLFFTYLYFHLGLLVTMLIYFILKWVANSHYEDFLRALNAHLGEEHAKAYDMICSLAIEKTTHNSITSYSISSDGAAWFAAPENHRYAPLQKDLENAFSILNKHYKAGRFVPLVLLVCYVAFFLFLLCQLG